MATKLVDPAMASLVPARPRTAESSYVCPPGVRAIIRDVWVYTYTAGVDPFIGFYVLLGSGVLLDLAAWNDMAPGVDWWEHAVLDQVLEAGDSVGIWSRNVAETVAMISGAELVIG